MNNEKYMMQGLKNLSILSHEIYICHISSFYTRRSQDWSFSIPPISSTWQHHLHSDTGVDFSSVHCLLLCCCLCFYLCASCLFKDRVWHFHGIWCRCDFIKQMCGLRQRWTGTNPAAALHRTEPCFPPTSADLGKMPPVQLKNLMPPHRHTLAHTPHPLMLMSRELPDTLISSYWEALLFHTWNLKMAALLCLLLLCRSFCSFTSYRANQHLRFWQAVIEVGIIQEHYTGNNFPGRSLCMLAVS